MTTTRSLSLTFAALLTVAGTGLAGLSGPGRYTSASRQMMAARKGGNRGMTGSNRAMMGRNSGQQNARRGQQQIAQELRGTRALLIHADHDYQGHRKLAVAEIDVALHAMGYGNNNNGNGQLRGNGAGAIGAGNGNGQLQGNGSLKKGNQNGGAGGRMKEPQAASDAQLRRAYQNLTRIEAQLSNLQGSQSARAAVMKAGGQIQLALKIR